MAYNDQVARAAASALMPEDAADTIIKAAIESSAALSMFRRVTMSRAQQRLPVVSLLPSAFWVNGDTGLKQTSRMEWANKYLNAEELAVIVPISDNVAEDAAFNIWDEVIPAAGEAIGLAFDAAVFLGLGKPASWDPDISTGAASAGNTVARGTHSVAQGGVAQDVSDLMSLVEADGYDVNGFVANRNYKGLLRSLRDTLGQRLLDVNVSGNEINGAPVHYGIAGYWSANSGQPELIGGDFSKGIVGIRRDIEWRILDQAVIQDNTGAIVYNFAQQDMKGLRMTFRGAFQVANPPNRWNPNAGTRYPFATATKP